MCVYIDLDYTLFAMCLFVLQHRLTATKPCHALQFEIRLCTHYKAHQTWLKLFAMEEHVTGGFQLLHIR